MTEPTNTRINVRLSFEEMMALTTYADYLRTTRSSLIRFLIHENLIRERLEQDATRTKD